MLRVILLIVFLLILALPVCLWWFAHSSLPQREGIIRFSSLHKEVEILSDFRDVPYIKARSQPDLYRAQGYWCASRRLFHMDMLRRLARGSLAEVFGSRCLAQDKLTRQLGFGRLAAREVKNMNEDVKKSLEQYCHGVNNFLESETYKNPLECSLLFYKPQKWTPEDSIAIMKYIEYLTNESWSLDDLRQKIVDKAGSEIASQLFEQSLLKSACLGNESIKIAGLDLLPPDSVASMVKQGLLSSPNYGSNGWVVAGAKADDKGSMLALDRHTDYMDPNLWYALTMTCPGFSVSGVTIPGVPGVMFGRNKHIGWGACAYKIDDQDLFVEKFSPEFPDKYKTPGGWEKVKVVVEEIKSRGSFGFGQDNFQHKVEITRHGPVLLSNEENAVCLNWVGEKQKKASFETYWKVNRAKNWQDFRDCLKDYDGTAQTFLFTDRQGAIGLQVAGFIPQRNGGDADSQLRAGQLVAGWTGESDWVSRVAFDSLPSFYNPEEGYLVANSKTFKGQMLELSPYPVERIEGLLKAKIDNDKVVGLPDLAKLQSDQYAPLVKLVKDSIKKSCTKQEIIDQYQLKAVKLLESWDGDLSKDSVSAAVYESFLRTLTRRMLVPKIGDALTRQYMSRWPRWTKFVESFLSKKDDDWFPTEERTFESFIVTSFAQAIADVRLATDSDDPEMWKWGNLHKAYFENLIFRGIGGSDSIGQFINPPLTPVGGDGDTISSSNLALYKMRNLFESNLGSTTRILLDMSDSDKMYETQPIGQSGHFFSDYRLDQLSPWAEKKPLLLPISDKEAMRQQRDKVVMTP